MTKVNEKAEILLPATKKVLTQFFEEVDSECVEDEFNEILQAWLHQRAEIEHDSIELANMVFSITRVCRLLRLLKPISSFPPSVEFFEQYSYSYVETHLFECLEAWISPESYTQYHGRTIADIVNMFLELSRFIRECSRLNFALEGLK